MTDPRVRPDQALILPALSANSIRSTGTAAIVWHHASPLSHARIQGVQTECVRRGIEVVAITEARCSADRQAKDIAWVLEKAAGPLL